MKQVKREAQGLCPLAGFAQCRGERCALWDDHWALCSLSSGSRYSGIRAAACDAAVEIMTCGKGRSCASRAYGNDSAAAPLRMTRDTGVVVSGVVIDT